MATANGVRALHYIDEAERYNDKAIADLEAMRDGTAADWLILAREAIGAALTALGR